jgi:hypothetical protein
MSTKLSLLLITPAGVPPAKGAVAPPQMTGVARIAGLGGLAEPIRIEPEVYCRQLGQRYAALGLAPCSDLGCEGCMQCHPAEQPAPRPTKTR